MRVIERFLSVLALVSTAATAVSAQEAAAPAAATSSATAATAATPPAPPPCADARHHAFDFWIGDWVVTLPDGNVAGHNRIEAIHGGCALHEHWTSTRGGAGSSLNIYDSTDGKWHQFWVDSTGGVLALHGDATADGMVLQGDGKGADGKPVRQRITWTKRGDGSVTQLWESSTDGGSSWTVAFNGTYRRRGGG